MTKYTIRLDTARKEDSGTNADVEGRITGTRGTSAWHVLDTPFSLFNPGDDREQGRQDYYRFEDAELGPIHTLELKVTRSDDDNPSWLLEAAYVAKLDTLELLYLPNDQWINPQATPSFLTLSDRGGKGWRREIDCGFLGTPNDLLW